MDGMGTYYISWNGGLMIFQTSQMLNVWPNLPTFG